MVSQLGKQIVAIYILPIISRTKDRQWNLADKQNIAWETFFLKNHTQNVMRKLFPVSFLKNQNWAYYWINSSKFYTVCFYCMTSWRL